ncbi:hypothetical protein HOY82DRAFT_592913 [Tuber indicum]|nr:hypothetical protein HOY82DRAFT_592913 [Tuber indicum]
MLFSPPHSSHSLLSTHSSRSLLSTHSPCSFLHQNSSKGVMDDLINEAVTASRPEGPQVLSHLERTTAAETEIAIHRKAINDGFAEIKGWVKMLVGFAGGTLVFGFGSLGYKVMVYDVNTNKEMIAPIEKVVRESEQKTGARLNHIEQKTHGQIESFQLWTKSEIGNLGRLVELFTKKR